jgi:ABC-2 type transport system permease protein
LNSFLLLLWDEFKGFAKSKIIIALWIGLPVLSIIMHFLQPATGDFPISLLTGLFVASIGGLLAAVILSSTMVNELSANVYDLYLIRPVKRWQIIVSKYIAVMISLIIAVFLSFAVGLIVDSIRGLVPAGIFLRFVLDSIVMAIAAMSIACAAGLFLGLVLKSVALAVILSIYLGQQLSLVAILPGVLAPGIDPLWFSLGVGLAATVVILVSGIFVFQKKQF